MDTAFSRRPTQVFPLPIPGIPRGVLPRLIAETVWMIENGQQATSETQHAHLIMGSVGEVLSWSQSLPVFIGRDAIAIPRTRRAWLELVQVEDRDRIRRAVGRAIRRGRRAELNYRLRHGRGEWIAIHEIMEPLEIGRASCRERV